MFFGFEEEYFSEPDPVEEKKVNPTIVITMGATGNLKPFDASTDDFEMWKISFESSLVANGVTDEDKKRGILLSTLGIPTLTLLHNLLSPKKPTTEKVDDILKTLQDHFKPAPKAIAERFKFMGRRQQAGETVQQFMAVLRSLATQCKFKDLDERLRDQFIYGLTSESAQRTLFTQKDDVSLQDVISLAVAQEAAETSTALIRSGHQPESQIHRQTGSQTGHKARKQQGKKTNYYEVKNNSDSVCTRCGYSNHSANDCPNRDSKCNKCGRIGHFAKMCKSKGKSTKSVNISSLKKMKSVSDKGRRNPPLMLKVKIGGKEDHMELDTGCEITVLSKEAWKKQGCPKLKPSEYLFKPYLGEQFRAMGEFTAKIQHNGQEVVHSFPVIEHGTSLFGKDLMRKIKVDWEFSVERQLRTVTSDKVHSSELKSLLSEYKDIFNEPSATDRIHKFRARIIMNDNAQPKFLKARNLPYAVRSKVEKELELMERTGVIEKIDFSEWASPLVVVPKSDGRVRITGDFKNTVNSQLCITQYPLALPEDIYNDMNGGTVFSKLDGSNAYHQLELEESCKKFCVINTHRGLFRYNVLPQGIASSPAIFQQFMDQMLKGIPKTGSYIDDTIATAANKKEHLKTLRAIFERMREFNFKLSKDKCELLRESVIFLGHKVSKSGIETSKEKVDAILEIPVPIDKSEMRSFLGFVQFYGKFVKNLGDCCAPLYELTENEHKWKWTKACQHAFNEVKRRLTSAPILALFDPALPVGLACDASPTGISFILYHRYPDGSERPIHYGSKKLSPCQQRYSQIEKEGFAIVVGMLKFYKYLCMKRFELITDHRPLLAIFGPKTQLPCYAATRLHHWSVFLSQFTYDIKYRRSGDHGNADALSRNLCMNNESEKDETELIVNQVTVEQLEVLPVTATAIRKASTRDKVLSRVFEYVQRGWPEKLKAEDDEVKSYFHHRNEIVVVQNVLMWGIRVIVPASLRDKILQQLHMCHSGIVRMKAMARSHVWWPGIDSEIEKMCKQCTTCNQNAPDPASAPLHPWQYPERPMQRVHMDLAGPFLGKMWLIMMDAHTKWPEVFDMKNITTTAEVKEKLMEFISRWGIMEQIVTDNGRQFVSDDFEKFCKINGIKHTTSAVYHPRSNGEAERFVRTFKTAMKADDVKDVNMRAVVFLFNYRTTPHSTTGSSPAELLQGRKLRTALDLVKPDPRQNVMQSQTRQEESYNAKAKMRSFRPGDAVWVKVYSRNQEKWKEGEIERANGPVSYLVRCDNMLMRRHVDQIRAAENDKKQQFDLINQELPDQQHEKNPTETQSPQQASPRPSPSPSRAPRTPEHASPEQHVPSPERRAPAAVQPESPKARPKRTIKKPVPFQAGAKK